MKKKILCILVMLSVVFAYSVPGIAINSDANISNNDINQEDAEQIVEIVDDAVSDDCVESELEKANGYYSGDTAAEVDVPVDSNDPISLGNEDGDIEVCLPESVEDEKGVLTESGDIVYDSTDNDVSIVTQVLDGECCGVRNCIVIEDYDAPNEYPFEFELPEGYQFIVDYDYDDGCEKYDCGDVYIVDSNGEITYTIEKPWAKDSNGDEIPTEFVINNNCLVQKVYFTRDTDFPVVADPAIISYKELTALYTKSQVKTLRDKYTRETNNVAWAKGYAFIVASGFMIDLGTAKILTTAGIATSLPVSTILAVTVSCVVYSGEQYRAYKYNTYNKFYEGFDKYDSRKRLKVVAYYKWSSNIEGYIEYKEPKLSYTSKTKL